MSSRLTREWVCDRCGRSGYVSQPWDGHFHVQSKLPHVLAPPGWLRVTGAWEGPDLCPDCRSEADAYVAASKVHHAAGGKAYHATHAEMNALRPTADAAYAAWCEANPKPEHGFQPRPKEES